MGIPILTSEGFIGRRFIIDDYFRAGDTLRAGDVAGVQQDPNQDDHPRLFKITLGVDPRRVVGVVHTPPALSLGSSIETEGSPAQVDGDRPLKTNRASWFR